MYAGPFWYNPKVQISEVGLDVAAQGGSPVSRQQVRAAVPASEVVPEGVEIKRVSRAGQARRAGRRFCGARSARYWTMPNGGPTSASVPTARSAAAGMTMSK